MQDFCLWAPPTAGPEIGASEEYEVTWCTASGHGARVMPEGTISSAHFLETEHYVQVTGTGDFTKINVKAGDEGGELDPRASFSQPPSNANKWTVLTHSFLFSLRRRSYRPR